MDNLVEYLSEFGPYTMKAGSYIFTPRFGESRLVGEFDASEVGKLESTIQASNPRLPKTRVGTSLSVEEAVDLLAKNLETRGPRLR